tara:strand:+ start:400 stop:585 length:186 start_codon:yes stop_codon:yes gene_type:complete
VVPAPANLLLKIQTEAALARVLYSRHSNFFPQQPGKGGNAIVNEHSLVLFQSLSFKNTGSL